MPLSIMTIPHISRTSPEALLNFTNVSLLNDLLTRPNIQVKSVQKASSPRNTPTASRSSFQSFA